MLYYKNALKPAKYLHSAVKLGTESETQSYLRKYRTLWTVPYPNQRCVRCRHPIIYLDIINKKEQVKLAESK